MHATNDLVRDVIVVHVAPPHQHIGVGQPIHGQSVLRLIEGRGADLEGQVLAQDCSQLGVDPLGIDPGNTLFLTLLPVLTVPDDNARSRSHQASCFGVNDR
ncbi:MAG: hypothetical protein U0075_08620 [Thermomicrobiales bacterium]